MKFLQKSRKKLRSILINKLTKRQKKSLSAKGRNSETAEKD
jgi:hypothetical protein